MVVACDQKRVGDDHLELEFQAVVNFLMRGLGTTGSSTGAVYVLNCGAFSPAPDGTIRSV